MIKKFWATLFPFVTITMFFFMGFGGRGKETNHAHKVQTVRN